VPEPTAPPRSDELLRALARWKLATLVLATLLCGALAAVLLLASKPLAAPIVADDEAPRHRPRRTTDDAPRVSSPRSTDDELIAQLRAASESLGWKVVSENRSKAEGLVQVTISASRGGAYLFMMVAQAKDEAAAESIAAGYATMSARGWMSRRDGRRVFTVSISSATPGVAAASSASLSAVLDAIAPHPGR
jgi:hypothetical protein